VRNKEFWREAIFFTSKDSNLTKSHVKYLESHLAKRVADAKRARLDNGNAPPAAQLPRSDRHAMEEFIENIELLLGALGYRFLEHVEGAISKSEGGAAAGDFICATGNAYATGAPSDEGFVVHKGSTAIGEASPKCPPYVADLRKQLLEEGILVKKGSLLSFAESYVFTSPSAAAAAIAGNSRNGREGWRLEDGRTLKAIEEQLAAVTDPRESRGPRRTRG